MTTPSPNAATPSIWSALRHPAFRGLWLASGLYFIANAMHAMAAAWMMVERTGSSFLAALVQTAVFLPMFVLALPAGVLADTTDRRRLILLALAVQAGAVLLLALLLLVGWAGPATILGLTFVTGCCTAMLSPAWNSAVGEILPREELPQAIVTMSIAYNTARALGPTLAGLVYGLAHALAPQGELLRGGTLRQCVSAGEALPAATRTLWREATGIELIDGIGATELLHIFISADEAHARPGATGLPVPGYRAEVVDEADRPLPPGQVGRLRVQGPTGCRYLGDARQREYVRGGWNYTGDAYLVDADGYFHFQARTDDMIVSAGYNIAAPEVEDALLLHPAVAECGVIGVADAARGQIVKAFVVLRPGQAADAEMAQALQDFVKQAIAPYKYPRAIAFVDQLPRTATGKLQRFRLHGL